MGDLHRQARLKFKLDTEELQARLDEALEATQEHDHNARLGLRKEYNEGISQAEAAYEQDRAWAEQYQPSTPTPYSDVPSGPRGSASRGNHSEHVYLIFSLAIIYVIVYVWEESILDGSIWLRRLFGIREENFRTYTIDAKESVSSTASIYDLQAPWTYFNWKMHKEARENSVWNVQVKQPHIQVVRAYTPLPDLTGRSGDFTFPMSILVRHEANGVVSSWLQRLGVSSRIEARGPYEEFRISDDIQRIIFVAGGTGIAPALQAADVLLNQLRSPNADPRIPGNGKRIHILWANRRQEDCSGGVSDIPPAPQPQPDTLTPAPIPTQDAIDSPPQQSIFSRLWKASTTDNSLASPTAGSPPPSPPSVPPPTPRRKSTSQVQKPQFPNRQPPNAIIQLIHALQTRHPGQLSISYFTDETSTTIHPADITTALRAVTSSSPYLTINNVSPPTQPLEPPSRFKLFFPLLCTSEERKLARLHHERDRRQQEQWKQTGQMPQPQQDKTQILVSGPEGFIATVAGRKVWEGGVEGQGALGGMVGAVLRELVEAAEEGRRTRGGVQEGKSGEGAVVQATRKKEEEEEGDDGRWTEKLGRVGVWKI